VPCFEPPAPIDSDGPANNGFKPTLLPDRAISQQQHIDKGTMRLEPLRRLLNDARFIHCAFIAETPIDEDGDDVRNVHTLRSLVD
jgi:hypothetical protein